MHIQTGALYISHELYLPVMGSYLNSFEINIITTTRRSYDEGALLKYLQDPNQVVPVVATIPSIVQGTGPAFTLPVLHRITAPETILKTSMSQGGVWHDYLAGQVTSHLRRLFL